MSAVVGVSAHFHDSACCVISDGVLVAAAEEERFTKRKHDPGLPTNAFRYCLQRAGLSPGEIDCLAYYEDPVKKAARQLWAGMPDVLADPGRRFQIDPSRPERDIRDGLGYDGPISFVDHHRSHAASAYYFSGFREAAILTVDGVGEWATTTFGRGAGGDLEILDEVTFPNSLGLFYSTITAYLGFEVNEAEFKVMGLAPYGRPRYTEELQQLVARDGDGRFRLDMQYFDFVRGTRMFSGELCDLLGRPAREPESEVSPFHEDVAASAQVVLEEALLAMVRSLHRRCPSDNLCMAGGVALNCVANARIRRDGPFTRLFVQPAAGDAGGALGAAATVWAGTHGCLSPQRRLRHVYLGPAYPSESVGRLVRASPFAPGAIDFTGDEPGLIRATAERLAAGKVVGWFQGRSEFGPRALGARSILADPRVADMRQRVNATVKKREAFRPFAPAVLESEAAAHFDIDHPSPFMLETFAVTSPIDLPAVTHVDGSARVQTVSEHSNPRFHALLREFARLTRCPVVLNTSFNLRGDPIALDPYDALWTFAVSDIDTLVIEDWVVDRGRQPPALAQIEAIQRARDAKRRAEAFNVYTFL